MITLEYMNVGHKVVFEIANTNIIFQSSDYENFFSFVKTGASLVPRGAGP